MTLPTLHPLCLSTTFELLNALSSSVLSLLCFLLHGRVLSTPRANPTFSKYKSNHPFSYTDHFFSNGFILLALKHIKSLLLKIKQINLSLLLLIYPSSHSLHSSRVRLFQQLFIPTDSISPLPCLPANYTLGLLTSSVHRNNPRRGHQ